MPFKPPKRPYRAKPIFRHPGQEQLWRYYQTQQRAPGFLERNFHLRNWKSYLYADAHKDALALATIITYKELLHSLSGSPSPATAPKAIRPALAQWFRSLPWAKPDKDAPRPGFVPGVGLKADDQGRVVFPLRDQDGRVWAVRAIDRDGRTCDIGDASARPKLRHVLDRRKLLKGDKPWRGPIVLALDVAAAAKLHEDLGAPVVIAAREKDLAALAADLRAAHPEAALTVALDSPGRSVHRAVQAVGARTIPMTQALDEAAAFADRKRSGKVDWLASKGRIVEVAPDLAEAMGAFVDDALSADDALGAKHEPRSNKEMIEVTPDRAKAMGAFEEDALTPAEAEASTEWRRRSKITKVKDRGHDIDL